MRSPPIHITENLIIYISHHGLGYKIAIKQPGTGMRGYNVIAKTLAEVHEAIDHYYGDGTQKPAHSGTRTETCPFCRMVPKPKK